MEAEAEEYFRGTKDYRGYSSDETSQWSRSGSSSSGRGDGSLTSLLAIKILASFLFSFLKQFVYMWIRLIIGR